MKYFRRMFSILCTFAVLTFPSYSFSVNDAKISGLRKASQSVLYEEVNKKLNSRISNLEDSLKEYIPDVKEVFVGSSVKDELGVKIKIYQNMSKEKSNYYYFLMATADKYIKNSSKDWSLLLNDLSFSFDRKLFLSDLEDHSASGSGVSNGMERGTTFILDGSEDEYFVGLKYYDYAEKKEGCLVYCLKILPCDNGFCFEGYANGDLSFQSSMGR